MSKTFLLNMLYFFQLELEYYGIFYSSNRFREGMATLGVLEACQQNPNTMAECLVTALQPPLTKSTLVSQMDIHIDLQHTESLAAHNCLMQLFEEYEGQLFLLPSCTCVFGGDCVQCLQSAGHGSQAIKFLASKKLLVSFQIDHSLVIKVILT